MTTCGWGRKNKKPCKECGTENSADFQRPTPHRGICDDCQRERQRRYDRERTERESRASGLQKRDPLAPTKGERATYQLLSDPSDSWPSRSTMSHTNFQTSLRAAVLPPGSVWLVRNMDGTQERVAVEGDYGPPDVEHLRNITPQRAVPQEASA
jgi:hypothetical protein